MLTTQLELADKIARKLKRAGFNARAPEWMAANDDSTSVVLIGRHDLRLTLTFGRLGWNLINADPSDKAEILRIARAVIARSEVS